VMACVAQKCATEYSGCFNSAACKGIFTCFDTCPDGSCYQTCYDQGTAAGQAGYDALASCAQAQGCVSGGGGDSCQGLCDSQPASGACYCDAGCVDYGDCCADYEQYCGGGGTPPGGDSCQGACGGQSGACYCDTECAQYGDCCPDIAQYCP
jgi:hypothetical protein